MAVQNDPRAVSPLHLPSVLPDYAPLFPYTHLNKMQSVAFDALAHSDVNVCVSSPTGSGKTLLFELGIVRLLMAPPPLGKTVYLAPLRALASERAADWRAKFGARGAFRGLSVALMVGGEGEGDGPLALVAARHHPAGATGRLRCAARTSSSPPLKSGTR
jgi:replicative superfamily II helicase